MLYVHIPFCVHKCHYCDFNSHVRAEHAWADYEAALLAELAYRAEQAEFAGRHIESIFFGGGTPSLAPPALISAVIETVRERFGLAAAAEISLEANPGTVDAANFRGYRQAGVNRLSIGVQSLDAAELEWLERIHSPEQALAAFHTGREAGFDNINLDLMYGLPGQRVQDWLQALDTVIRLAPEHLSCYQLTVEPHTKLAATHRQQPLPLPDDEASLHFFRQTREHLASAGYLAYEISNFALPDRRCRHNDGYWLYHDYIGIGAGAAGKCNQPGGGTRRYSNIRAPEAYMDKAVSSGHAELGMESLDPPTAAAEAIWMGLRRSDGLDRHWFSERFGRDAMLMFEKALLKWQRQGGLIIEAGSIRLSPTGLTLADSIAADLF